MQSRFIVMLWLALVVGSTNIVTADNRTTMVISQTLKKLTPSTTTGFSFTQKKQRLGHLSRPWQTYQRNITGRFFLIDSASKFYQNDSINLGNSFASSRRYFCDTTLVVVDYGEQYPDKKTIADKESFPFDICDVTPVFLLRYCLNNQSYLLHHTTGSLDSLKFKSTDGGSFTLIIDPVLYQLKSIILLYPDDLYGDILSTVIFSEYVSSPKGDFIYPSKITRQELGFETNLAFVNINNQQLDLSLISNAIPENYHLAETPSSSQPEVLVSKYKEGIYFVDLKHANTRSVIVEFKDFLVITEAPLNSVNGEMIIRKAQELAPRKPIRYFLFGHHHPHYIGGIRAFIHHGVTVLSTASDSVYISQLSLFPHRINPDSLALSPRALKLEIFEKSKTITDGDMEMQIVHIGKLSKHTEDYLVYYFPKYKLLFQGDLIWMRNEAIPTAANPMQKGLYEAIIQNNLTVEEIVQSWMINNPRMKTIISFQELQKSVELAP